ncbi:MAG: hypothetical protein PWP45_1641 [Tepidanaerobacteraceae bacterium]|nr:hypothetical protein [Tepidanaerobacteraceae bacterium]
MYCIITETRGTKARGKAGFFIWHEVCTYFITKKKVKYKKVLAWEKYERGKGGDFIKRFVIEFGYGVDLHGQDVNNAAKKAVKDAISHSCLCGLTEILNLDNLDDVIVEVTVAVSRPEEIDEDAIKELLPIGKKSVKAVEGGIGFSGLNLAQFGDINDSIEVAVACVTVGIE